MNPFICSRIIGQTFPSFPSQTALTPQFPLQPVAACSHKKMDNSQEILYTLNSYISLKKLYFTQAEQSVDSKEQCSMAGLDYTCSMPTNRHRTHDAVDRSFYDAINQLYFYYAQELKQRYTFPLPGSCRSSGMVRGRTISASEKMDGC